MSNCTCGRTTRPPMCDGSSHALTEAQYQERTARLSEIWARRNVWNDPVLAQQDHLAPKTNKEK